TLNKAIVKITDFGLAKQLNQEGLTKTGDILGTPSYMAPEQATGRIHDVGARTDAYSQGAILYDALTGKVVVEEGDSPRETLEQVANEDPVPPRRHVRAIPKDIETICLKCLEKSPDKRYASAGELADDLRRFLHGEPIHARKTRLLKRAIKWA